MKGQVQTYILNILPKTHYLNASTLVSSSLQCPNPNSPLNIHKLLLLVLVFIYSFLYHFLPLRIVFVLVAAKQILGWSGLFNSPVRRADVDIFVPSVLGFVLCFCFRFHTMHSTKHLQSTYLPFVCYLLHSNNRYPDQERQKLVFPQKTDGSDSS